MRTQIRTHARAARTTGATRTTRTALAAVTALTLAATAACGTEDPAEAAGGADAGQALEIVGGWAKATDTEMSGVFGTIQNNTPDDVPLTGVSGDIDGSVELHETVPGGGGMMMQEKEDGFVIPGGGELVLEPGGNHIMLMDLTEPITTGQEIDLTLEIAGGEGVETSVSARDFQGGEEEYVGGGHADHGGEHGADHDG